MSPRYSPSSRLDDALIKIRNGDFRLGKAECAIFGERVSEVGCCLEINARGVSEHNPNSPIVDHLLMRLAVRNGFNSGFIFHLRFWRGYIFFQASLHQLSHLINL